MWRELALCYAPDNNIGARVAFALNYFAAAAATVIPVLPDGDEDDSDVCAVVVRRGRVVDFHKARVTNKTIGADPVFL